MPEYRKLLEEGLKGAQGPDRRIALWSRKEVDREARKPLGEDLLSCVVSEHLWNGFNLRPPMMYLGDASALGVVSRDHGSVGVSFALADRPFSGDLWFRTQHLVASVSLIGMVVGADDSTFQPPYIPELNEFFARNIYFDYNRLRVEPQRLGIIIDAADHDLFVRGLSSSALIAQIFDLAGFVAKPSGGGLITQQLISKLGGVEGARVFKIPGVRRLIRQYGPTASFTRQAALQMIGGKDPKNPQALFSDHLDLYIEPRPRGTNLTPDMVFAHLVERGLFRIGVDLTCPTCRLDNWIALDALKQTNVCEMCGAESDATRQLINADFHYRRTGVLGLERNSQGAVPVALVLQQLTSNLDRSMRSGAHAASLDLSPKQGTSLPTCETDFVVLLDAVLPDKPVMLIGEVKDAGGAIDANDVENLRQVADALVPRRLETFIVFAKLGPFSDAEVALAKSLNEEWRRRVILLTARELEPRRLLERTQKELGIKAYGTSAQELAGVTVEIYFKEPQ